MYTQYGQQTDKFYLQVYAAGIAFLSVCLSVCTKAEKLLIGN